MKKKLIIDSVMAIVMLMLINKFLTGLLAHEILGLLILVLFAVHLMLNRKWISGISGRVIREYSKLNGKTKAMYFLNILLFLLMSLSVITGILVSEELFDFTIENKAYLAAWHHFLSYWLAVTLAVHIGLHWNIIRSKLNVKKGSFIDVSLICICLSVMVYVFVRNDAFKKLIPPRKEDYVIVTEENTNTADDTADNKEDIGGDGNPTLAEYLSGFRCTGCTRHCLLSNPSCGWGRNQAKEKETEYYEMYGVGETYVG